MDKDEVYTGSLISAALILFCGIAISVLGTNATYADEGAGASVRVGDACTMIATGSGAYSASVSPGTSSEIPGSTIKINCNDVAGFSIYTIGYSDDSFGNTNLIGASGNIATNTSGSDSYWAMKINPTSGNIPTILDSFDSYHVVPATYTKIATSTSATTSELSVSSAYKVSISSAQVMGSYVGKVKYTLVHPNTAEPEIPPQPQPAAPGKIVYHANASDVVGTMGDQDLIIARDWSSCYDTDYETYCNDSNWNEIDITTLPELDYYSNTLYASNFKRDGYGFAGWSDAYDYATNPNAHFYGPNETITTPFDLSTSGLSLYAIWIPSAGSLQSDGATTCNSLTKAPAPGGATTANLSSVSALTDDRDGNTYAIAKLADNKCWIIENLRLADKDANNNDINLSSTNTHNPSLPLTNIYDSSTTSNHLSPTSSVDYNAVTAPEGWCTSVSAACLDQSRLRTDNTTLFTNNTSSSYSVESDVYSYGNYYNWYSATAGNGTYNKDYGYESPGDICPAGWRLPTGGSATAEFGALDVAMGGTGDEQSGDAGRAQSAKWRSYPNNILYSGGVYGSSVINRSSYVNYWSSSAADSIFAHILSLGRSAVYSSSTVIDKHNGLMVRCVIGV